MNKQASLLAATSQAAEASGLKLSLERAKEELGLVKRQMEDKQGMWRLVVYSKRINNAYLP